ncbi:hypothetical protein [Aquimarina sp. 2201CG14-23]|uniref:hypothetical protein n=1 Tax=Aquimarina mycalae TaxID=3040073 RepID=UPI002477DD34|nr:hypothetical protein [Aquimarina sp. 2201CG14-23]MDH7447903.1 hypothetical protein [Aquimarina sp. 2201CG14-23]
MKNYIRTLSILLVSTLLSYCAACSKDDDASTLSTIGTIDPGNDPNFKIVENTDTGFTGFNRKVEVFDIPIYAVAAVEDVKLLHAANVMAQYLDNDEDGVIDNQAVVTAMKNNNAFLFLWKNESDLETLEPPSNAEGQDLGNDETIPGWHTNGHTGRFDAALEEVLHIITHTGYASAYPEVFGEHVGTDLANAMDIARGGQFTTIPNPYPDEAWYTYDDTTCDYNCMTTEYIYWSLTSMLGAQENRLNEINQEWRLNTRTLVENTDTAVYALLTDTQYKFPVVLPDGSYKQ